MKFIIDLIDDIREEIENQEDFILTAMLLKDNPEDEKQLIYAGESGIGSYTLDKKRKQLLFNIDKDGANMTVGELIKPLLILTIDVMMYTLKMDINRQYRNIEIVGFGKSKEAKKYIFFIKI